MKVPSQPKDKNVISKKKLFYDIDDSIWGYLKSYGRSTELGISYKELLSYKDSITQYSEKGEDTSWETVIYDSYRANILHEKFLQVYSSLKTGGIMDNMRHLRVDRIDYCPFGNSNPFRIKIINNYNDVYEYFYVKIPDVSRILGLELEHITASDKVHFLANKDTLIEEHIHGIPGDIFLKEHKDLPMYSKKRLAKEFVKFNQRCFIRLLGDMRSYNYVFVVIPDYDDVHIKIRAIDFDQQCYEGSRNIYFPQFFKENYPLVKLVQEELKKQTIIQYQQEEKAIIGRRIAGYTKRLKDLIHIVGKLELSPRHKLEQLREELAEYYKDSVFLKCDTMGMLLERCLKITAVFNVVKWKY